jgi:hypothetical protein
MSLGLNGKAEPYRTVRRRSRSLGVESTCVILDLNWAEDLFALFLVVERWESS